MNDYMVMINNQPAFEGGMELQACLDLKKTIEASGYKVKVVNISKKFPEKPFRLFLKTRADEFLQLSTTEKM